MLDQLTRIDSFPIVTNLLELSQRLRVVKALSLTSAFEDQLDFLDELVEQDDQIDCDIEGSNCDATITNNVVLSKVCWLVTFVCD